MSSVVIAGNTSGTITLDAPNVAGTTVLTLPTANGTVLTTANTFGAGTGPTFSAYRASNQSISANTLTKIAFDTEEWDSASCFDTSTNRFTPNVAGYYQIDCIIACGASGTAADGMNFGFLLYKNGSTYKFGFYANAGGSNDQYIPGAFLVYCNGTTDYLEIYYACSKAININGGSSSTWFTGFLARAA
jgi:hypothetical protein